MTRFSDAFAGDAWTMLADEHGESITYRAPGAASVQTINAIIDRAQFGSEESIDGKRRIRRAVVTILTNATSGIESPVIGASLTFDGRTWAVIDIPARNAGIAELSVESEERIEAARQGFRRER